MPHILLVQASEMMAAAVRHVLASHGHRVVVAHSCREAESKCEQFDVGILDLRLPDGSGVHLAARLSGFGRLRSRIFYTDTRHGPLSQPRSVPGPILSHGAPIERLLAEVDNVLAALDRESVQPRSVRRCAPSMRTSNAPAEAGGSGGSLGASGDETMAA